MKVVKDSAEFMASFDAMFGAPEEFRPTATYIAEGDCIEFFARSGSFYAERIDDLVTVYYSRQNNEIIGSLIKDVGRFCREILAKHPAFKIVVEDGPVRLEHLFLAKIMSYDEDNIAVATYKKLMDVAEEVDAKAELCATA